MQLWGGAAWGQVWEKWGPWAGREGRSNTALFMQSVPSSRRVYKEHLGLSQKVAIGYQAHADTATKSGSLTKTKFVV